MTSPLQVGVVVDSRSRLDELVAACTRRRRAFFRYALPLFVVDFLAPALSLALLERNAVLASTLLLLPFPIACVLTWRLLRAACPWCSRSFFLRTRTSRTPPGRYLVFSTLLERSFAVP